MDVDEAPFDFEAMREYMLQQDIIPRGINSDAVLEALGSVSREFFVKPVDWDEAYADTPLQIDCGQTISQPYIVALMSQLLELESGMSVLEIGTGSGYQAAVLSAMGAKVYSVERHELLSRAARDALKKAGLLRNVTMKIADGSIGWQEKAPFDRIILTCCAPEIPKQLLEQLSADNGVLVSPVARDGGQVLEKIVKTVSGISVADQASVVFVPLKGEFGYD